MTKLFSCRYNMDTNRVEARFEDGTTLAIDCIAVEDEYGSTAGRAGLATLQQAPGVCTDGAERGDGALPIAGVRPRQTGGLNLRKRAAKMLIARRAFLSINSAQTIPSQRIFSVNLGKSA